MWIAGRILQGLGVIWGIITLLFLIFFALGDPTAYLVGDQADEATILSIQKKYGLDQPLHLQYLGYLNNLSPVGWLADENIESGVVFLQWGRGGLAVKAPDLGTSFQGNRSVSSLLAGRLQGTLILALAATLPAVILGILMGLWAALAYRRLRDKIILFFAMLGVSAPSFFVAVLLAWLFAVKLRPWTGLNLTGYLFEPEIFDTGVTLALQNLILPALALSIRPLAIFVQLTRSSILEVLGMDYVRTAKAKGLQGHAVLLRHALTNALNPVLTAISGWFASLLAGSFFVEYIFGWQGLGKLMIDALNANDFPVILGCSVLIACLFVLIQLLTDLAYVWLDPRVRLS